MIVRHFRTLTASLLALALAIGAFVGCENTVPGPLSGWAEYQDLLFVRVPGGRVNAGGGNFLTRRVDLSIDTRVGTYAVGAAYNSAAGGWRWAHEMSYSGSTFVDETGASFDLSSVANGSPIPGTHWVRLDADSMKTKGGLVHDFSASGKLSAIHWLGFDYPQLRFTTQIVGGGIERVVAIDQCTAASTCTSFFTLAYTPAAQLQTVTDRASRVASFTWDGSGRLATAKDGLDTAKGWLGFRYEYSGANLTAITSSENERLEYTYDTAARLLTAKKIGDGNPTYTFQYFAGQSNGYYLTRFTNPLSQVVEYSFDVNRRLFILTQVTAGETTSFLWNGLGRRVTRITRPDGVQTNFVITGDDVTQIQEPSGNVVDVSYLPSAIDPGSPNARPIDVVSDSVGLVLDRGYDQEGRLITVSNGAGDTTTYAWQSGSPTGLASVTAPSPAGGVLTTYGAQGDHGHPASATTGPHTKNFVYDLVGNLLDGQDTSSEISPGMGGVVSRSFDADRNVASVVLKNMLLPQPQEETMTLERRSDGRLTAIRPPGGGDTEFDYSATGRVLARRERANAAWVPTSFGYDALDRVTSTELANGMRAELGYDAAGRVNAITSKRSGIIEETLSRAFAQGRITSTTDSAYTGPESYTYDSIGRVSTITYPGGEWREFTYDLRSRVTSERFVQPSGVALIELFYTYDAADRLTELRRGVLNTLVLKYTYTSGFVTQTDYQNGLRRTTTINPGFALPQETLTTNASQQTLENTYNDLNSLLILTSSVISGNELYETYGLSSEWRAVQDPGALSNGNKFDGQSNLREREARELLYNTERNRLTQIRDIAAPQTVRHTYQYDAAGFATDRDGVAFGYDATGAIASIGSIAAFDHDLDGRPVSRTLSGVSKVFRFGGAIAYSPAGSPLEMDLGEVVFDFTTGGIRFRHTDFRGNVQFVSKGNGTIDGYASYAAFGRLSTSGNLGERGFAQGFELPSLGLVVLGPRVLDSDAGRFLSQDPVFNAVNQYAYAQGNPVYFWDPSGRRSDAQAAAATGMAFGGGLGAAGAAVAGGAAAWAPAAFVVGATWSLALYNHIAIAVDPDGSSRVSAGEAWEWVSQFIPQPIMGNESVGVGGGSGGEQGSFGPGGLKPGTSYQLRPKPDSPGFGPPPGEGSFGDLGSLSFTIAISFGGAFW